ncbi:hypothetical protein AVT69_gp248 [Pseudomonas phage PhiPA3]|uniref:Uncharacterized protein 250 n=1 Tax=Pseudomonas phage PhiPA3 TaxID=998086 RepID=F8SJM2_BPPA3|nr:hypothetical protein AVT69_gp248 [Pseudomonas phage PhiPA3]AEH03673.1 hypothetical protein [Pseudomonas phage PhiPA3]
MKDSKLKDPTPVLDFIASIHAPLKIKNGLVADNIEHRVRESMRSMLCDIGARNEKFAHHIIDRIRLEEADRDERIQFDRNIRSKSMDELMVWANVQLCIIGGAPATLAIDKACRRLMWA